MTTDFRNLTPRQLGYTFPAEWEKHSATWLSYPHNENSWPGRINNIFQAYNQFIKEISKGEDVNINVQNEEMLNKVKTDLSAIGTNMSKIKFFVHPTNDAWCRDHGPAFLINPKSDKPKVIVNWEYNAWGNKYPHDLDNTIPLKIAEKLGLQVFNAGIVMEGGAVDFNGKGTLITSKACLLNKNRNPLLTQTQIENYLCDYYGVDQVLWVNDGIEGDDTDGHIDDTVRFINEDTVVAAVEPNKNDANHLILKENIELLKEFRLLNGKQLNIVELPMPEPMYIDDQRVPASYANFYICNSAVIVPIFNSKNDNLALDILSNCFKDRPVIGIDSSEIIWGLGSFHCLSQQEPFI
jgi:agmatine deiminase